MDEIKINQERQKQLEELIVLLKYSLETGKQEKGDDCHYMFDNGTLEKILSFLCEQLLSEERLSWAYGWNDSSYAGPRGIWFGKNREETLDHLINWLEDSKIAGQQDPAGNIYYGVDSYILQQTIEQLNSLKGEQHDNS